MAEFCGKFSSANTQFEIATRAASDAMTRAETLVKSLAESNAERDVLKKQLQAAEGAAAQSRRFGNALSAISRHYYGTVTRWPEIFAANRDVLRDERNLIAGRTLRIP